MKNLFDKTQLGKMTLENRFIRAAIGEKATKGHVNEFILDLYQGLAQGGVGTMITGFTLVDENEKNFPMLAFYDDSFRDGHIKLTNLVHKYNKNIILQLVYIGSYVMGDARGMSILAPSVVENLNTKVMPQEITVEQIKRIQQKFADTASRAKDAGYNGIEIHAAHGFLLSQFMTPYYNRRKDLYGGTVQNRARMALETYEAIRRAVGEDFPVWIKINVTDGFENEVSLDDALYLCKELTEKGINAIEISGAFSKFANDATSFFKNEAEKIAMENDTAIILTGGNKDFKEMTEILNTTKISYFGIARALTKEPGLINRFKKEFTK
ncbi:NADH:flavin oxidoreductase [Leadbettera azotonutricia]|uniref:NADH:flavin oxidoreductase/nadh oxidase n=1 Tax=Leadbettera azotonutricia (strain ATCC BAA-888 / DSM 13862 / ZAS-9) TaxID=545695 RepID=F5Y818_LEAAZ|nr:NADH:flavin oxidoreductase [Leadbettera azotonutricia]AEF80584.1 NADH:flavin oxidoreductase/nadh oxidase [Leadbettera azotonutricia ZAS-9]